MRLYGNADICAVSGRHMAMIHRLKRLILRGKIIFPGNPAALNVGRFSPRNCPASQISESQMGFKVAVVGATGNVGREMLNILSDRRFPADEVVALASRKSMGVEVSYGDKTLKCKALDQYDFSD